MNFNNLNSIPIIQTQTHHHGVAISDSLHKVYFSDTLIYFSLDKKEQENEREKDLMRYNHESSNTPCQLPELTNVCG